MIKLLEKELLLKVRKEDLALVNSITAECEIEFKEIMDRETNEEYFTKLVVVESEFLTNE